MSSGEARRVSHQDIQLVQDLIERCLQLYMNQKEVVDTLLMQAKIEPDFTELVWQKLEEENRDFFKAYHVRLVLKNQIMVFNRLLEKQVEVMRKLCQPAVSSVPHSNGSSAMAVHPTPPSYMSDCTNSSRQDNMLCNGVSSRPLINGGSTGSHAVQVSNDASVSAGRLDLPTNMLSGQNSTLGMLQGMNGTVVKTEPNFSDNLEYPFYPDGNFLETRTSMEDEGGASFGSSDLAGTQLNEQLQELDNPPFGFLSQLPRNFSFSDLTDDFTQDIIENYGRSPFLASEANNFPESPDGGGNMRLDTISEGMSHEDFASD